MKKMIHNANAPPSIQIPLGNNIHLLDYPAWIFDEKTLRIVDANYMAMEFCMYEEHEIIGLSILELWHNDDLLNILDDLVTHHFEWSFFGNLRHRKKNGEMVVMHVRATRLLNSKSLWIVHLVKRVDD